MKQDRVEQMIGRAREEFPSLDTEAKEVFARLVRLQGLIGEWTTPVLNPHGLNLYMYAILATLKISGPPYALRPRDILDQTIITSGGLSNILNRLERLQLVRRERDQEDGRGVRVSLTPGGDDLTRRLISEMTRVEQAIVAPLTRRETSQLARLLRKVLLGSEAGGGN